MHTAYYQLCGIWTISMPRTILWEFQTDYSKKVFFDTPNHVYIFEQLIGLRLDLLLVEQFGGFTIWCTSRGEAKTRTKSWEKVDIQSLRNTNVTWEQMPMFVQIVNIN